MRTLRISFCVLLLLIAGGAAAITRIVPIAGHTEGAFGTAWRTDLLVTNSAGQSQSVQMTFYPTASPPVTRSFTIEALDSIVVPDALDPAAFGLPPQSWTGQLILDAPRGIDASAHIWSTTPDRDGTYGGTIESYDPAIVPTHGTLTALVVDDTFRSNVAFANVTPAWNSIQLTLRDAAGTVVASDRLDLAAHETTQISIGGRYGVTGGVHSIEWTATVAAIAIASVIDNRSGDPSHAPSVANAHDSLCFPIVGRTGGALGTVWNTALTITTESDSPATVTLVYHGGDDVTLQRVATLPANGTLQIPDLGAYFGTSGLGYLHLDANAPVVAAARIFTTDPDGATYGSLLLPQESMAESDVIRIRGVRRTAEFRANVVLTNRTDQPTAGWLRFFDRRGDLVEKHWFVLQAHDLIQVPLTGSVAPVEAGEVEIRTADAVHLLAVVSNVDNASGDTLVREVDQELERQLEP